MATESNAMEGWKAWQGKSQKNYVLSFKEFREIFNSRKAYHLTEDEMRIAAGEFIAFSTIQAASAYESGNLDDPEDVIYCVALTDKRTGKDYLACLDALDDDEELLDEHIRLKDDYPLYIPSPEEAEDVWANWYPKNTNVYVKKTIDGFVTKFKVDREEAEEIVGDLWMTFALNGDPTKKMGSPKNRVAIGRVRVWKSKKIIFVKSAQKDVEDNHISIRKKVDIPILCY